MGGPEAYILSATTRPHLEFTVQVWNPRHLRKTMKKSSKIAKRFLLFNCSVSFDFEAHDRDRGRRVQKRPHKNNNDRRYDFST
jgi:hypothetical protein